MQGLGVLLYLESWGWKAGCATGLFVNWSGAAVHCPITVHCMRPLLLALKRLSRLGQKNNNLDLHSTRFKSTGLELGGVEGLRAGSMWLIDSCSSGPPTRDRISMEQFQISRWTIYRSRDFPLGPVQTIIFSIFFNRSHAGPEASRPVTHYYKDLCCFKCPVM